MVERRFPLFVNLAGRKVLLFGGGPVALRRARTLVAFGPDLTVIAPEPDPAFSLCRSGWSGGPTGRGAEGAFLVLAATDDEEVNRAIAAEARAREPWPTTLQTAGTVTFSSRQWS